MKGLKKVVLLCSTCLLCIGMAGCNFALHFNESSTSNSASSEELSTESSSVQETVILPDEPQNFSFSLTWGVLGISSYDSASGKLIKTDDVRDVENYTTTYFLAEEETLEIYNIIRELDVASYPDTYNPNPHLGSDPSMDLILSVKTDTLTKTIEAKGIALEYTSDDEKGQKFLDACNSIRTLLIETEEWKALPEYPYQYD